jgi:hypothetical protein
MTEKKKIRIEMKRTLAPKEIPNGTKGWMAATKTRGLHLAFFDTGYKAFVYRSEIKEVVANE